MTPKEELRIDLVEAAKRFTDKTGVVVENVDFSWYSDNKSIKEDISCAKIKFR